MKKILFVCTGNAGRSQMAEALFRPLGAGRFEVLSAGVDPWDDLHPMARKLMAERGIDLAGHHPKHVREFADEALAAVVTIGDRADAESPDFRTGVRRIHWPIDDPADADGTPASESVFRSTCERIEARLPSLVRFLDSFPPPADNAWVPAIATTVLRPAQFQPAVHLPMFVAAGFRHIELCCYKDLDDFPWEDAGAVADLKHVAADLGVTIVSLHPPDRGNLASLDSAERNVQADVLRRFTDLAVELGAGSLSAHFGYGLPEGEPRSRALARQAAELDALAEYAAPSPVVVCLETLSGRAADTPNADIIRDAEERSAAAFGVVLDTGHPQIAGDLHGLAEQAGRRLQNLHLHDNDARGDQHFIPGRGTIDWPRFMLGLAASGYEGPLMLEVQTENPEALKAELAACSSSVDTLRSYCA